MPPSNAFESVGQTYHLLEVLDFKMEMYGGRRRPIAICRCACGRDYEGPLSQLKTGNTKSCGCHNMAVRKMEKPKGALATYFKHGLSRSPIYRTWRGMITRCTNQNTLHYHRYGGRGIRVCERWLKSFEDFHADMGDRPTGYTLDRIDNDYHYCLSNCRWATRRQQSNNRHNNLLLSHNGQTLSVAEWARKLSLSEGAIRRRWRKKLSIEKILLPKKTKTS